MCAVKITTDNDFTCLIVSAYLPCDTYTGTVQQAYFETIDYIESLINEHECKSVILCGDYNTSFERKIGQVDCLNDFISRYSFKIAWENTNSKKDFTYTNVSLGHKSCIDHILVDNCIFDRIIDNYVIYDGANPSNHNVLYLSIKNFRDMLHAKSDCIDRSTKHVCSWERASFDDITSYKANIDSELESFIYDYDVIYCNDIHCNNDVHRAKINEMCCTIISIC